MDDALSKLRQLALNKAAASEDLGEIAKATTIAKELAETGKSVSETTNANRQMRLEVIKSVGTFLVPVVSLLAMLATLITQNQQLAESRTQIIAQQTLAQEQAEDTQWRELLSSLKSIDVLESDPTISPRLQSFYKSARYGDQAKQISIHMMGRLTNVVGFTDLYNIAFPEADDDNVVQIVSVLRSLTNTRRDLGALCNRLSNDLKFPDNVKTSSTTTYWGYCFLNISETDFIKANGNKPVSPSLAQARQAFAGLVDEQKFVSEQLSAYLRKNYYAPLPSRQKSLDLSNTYIDLADLSDVDFSNINAKNTEFDWTKLDRARLTPTSFEGIVFYASNWWDASTIDQKLLDTIVVDQFPFEDPAVDFSPLSPPTEDHYREQVVRLCAPSRPACEAGKARFRADAGQ